jgi:hypothetical protein
VSYAKGDMQGVFKSVNSVIKSASGGTQKADQYAKKTRTSPADVVSVSAPLQDYLAFSQAIGKTC